ncbi:hypothetical protein EDB85DRAFT_2148279 [Lactarius pseudohatsudake]|nr:hypothetical protein EDB85DRAFT_2148279 [Lactarius pseudohatsudake]
MDEQAQVIHLKEISVDFIKKRPISDIELVFKDDAGVTHTSNQFKSRLFLKSDPVRWNIGIYLKTHTSATLTIQKSKSPADVTRVLGSQITSTNTIAPMNTQQPRCQIPEVRFRVLIIGRANAGKTSILKRICETTKSPVIHRGREKVTLDPSMDRGEHTIDDELVFSNHRGYVFHDSRGIESGVEKGDCETDYMQYGWIPECSRLRQLTNIF